MQIWKEDKEGRDELVKLAADCEAIPIWASSVMHKMQLIDLRYNKEYVF